MKVEELKRNPICHCSDEKPKLLQVKIINKCTGDCWFCIDKGNYTPQTVDPDRMIKAILSEPEYPTVDITGGEPLLDFEVLLKVLRAIRPYKEYIILNTNGSLLTEEKVNQLNGLIDFLKIGLQHYDEMKNAEIIKTKVNFEDIKKSLINKHFKVWFNMVINESWENNRGNFVDELVELCKKLNVDGVSMNELRYTGVNNGYEQYAEGHIKGYDFFHHLNVIKPKTSEQLITEGCVDDFEYKGIEFRLKRLCGYKLKSKVQTFKVIYSDGLKADDWLLDI